MKMNYNEAKKAFIKGINTLARTHSTYTVFKDFCECAAIALYQPFGRNENLEKTYLSTIGKYSKEEAHMISELLSYVVFGLSSRFGDFLGECYMELSISNKNNGQFFTPYYISKFMSQLAGESNKDKLIETMSEPCVGSGGFVIARAEYLMEQNINYQKVLKVQATDIDRICFYMSYIHFTLLHIPVELVWGNTLTLEIFDVWYTPAYLMNMEHYNRIGAVNKLKEIMTSESKKIIEETQPIYTSEQIKAFNHGKLF
jgi:type I restriction-modification system DNA methylase subunit